MPERNRAAPRCPRCGRYEQAASLSTAAGLEAMRDVIRSRLNLVTVVGRRVRLRKQGGEWVGLCPLHQEKTPSFSVNERKQSWYCFGCRQGGDIFRFVELVEKTDFSSALRRLVGTAGLEVSGRDQARCKCSQPAPRPAARNDDERGRPQSWERRWAEAVADDGRVSAYLRHRGLSGEVPQAVRLHSDLAYFEDGRERGRFPAMVALFRRPDGKAVGLHRTYLDPQGPGKAILSEGLSAKKFQGSVKGAAIHVGEPGDGMLAVTEGIETALAVQEATGMPAWAAGSAGGMAELELPVAVTDLWVWADAGETGEAAAGTLARRAVAAGMGSYVLVPPSGDWLDVLALAGAAALRQATEETRPWQLAENPPSRGRQAAHGAEDNEWASPLPEPPPFPLEPLPEPARGYVKAVAALTGLPLDFLGVTALGVLAGAIGGLLDLVVDATWKERAIVWALIVGEPGDRKSPAMLEARRGLDEAQRQHLRAYESARLEWEAVPVSARTAGSEPRLQRLLVGDTTIEALARILRDNPAGVVLIADEVRTLLQGLNQYKARGQGADRARLLELWPGLPWMWDRVKDGVIYVPRPTLSVVGGMQPALLGVLEGDDGLRDRFLIAAPASRPAPRRCGGQRRGLQQVPEQDSWQTLVKAITSIRDVGGRRHLTAEARIAFDRQHDRLMDVSEDCLEVGHVRTWARKAPSHLLRLALVLCETRRVATAVAGPGVRAVESAIVEAVDVEAAGTLIAYFLDMRRSLYLPAPNLMASPRERDHDQAVDKLLVALKQRPDGRLRLGDVVGNNIGGTRTREEAQALLDRFAAIYPGCVLEEKPGRGRSTLVAYHPGREPGGRLGCVMHGRPSEISGMSGISGGVFGEDGSNGASGTPESNSGHSRGPVPEKHPPDIPEIPDISQDSPALTRREIPASTSGALEPAVHCPNCGALTAAGQPREHRAGWIRCQGCEHEWLPRGEGEWEIVL